MDKKRAYTYLYIISPTIWISKLRVCPVCRAVGIHPLMLVGVVNPNNLSPKEGHIFHVVVHCRKQVGTIRELRFYPIHCLPTSPKTFKSGYSFALDLPGLYKLRCAQGLIPEQVSILRVGRVNV